MPTYDYECRNCGHRVEVLHGVNASGPTACERCGGPMRKLVSAPAIVFKGSGWAKKDRGAKAPAKAGTASEKGDGSDTAGSDAGVKTKEASSSKPTEAGGSSSGTKGSSAAPAAD